MDPRISIVLPCRNDAVELRATLGGVSRLQDAHAVEVIVAAAGDEERTLETAAGRATVVCPSGSTRSELLNAGAAVARAPVLLFLRADSHLPADAVPLIERALRGPGVLSGAFEHNFSERDWRLRIISAIDRVRYRVTRNYYGDQGQFVRTEVFRAIGGFPSVKMMEDQGAPGSSTCRRARARPGCSVAHRRDLCVWIPLRFRPSANSHVAADGGDGGRGAWRSRRRVAGAGAHGSPARPGAHRRARSVHAARGETGGGALRDAPCAVRSDHRGCRSDSIALPVRSIRRAISTRFAKPFLLRM